MVTPEEQDPSASLRIWQKNVDCGSGNVTIEVASDNVANGGSYSFALPAGTYNLVASTDSETILAGDDINKDTTELNITFGL